MQNENAVGKINISDEILCSCVANTAKSFEGVMGFDETAASGAFALISRDLAVADGVRLFRKDDKVTVDLFIIVEYGTKIPKLAWELQKQIQEDIRKITEEDISDINIHIEGVGINDPVNKGDHNEQKRS